MKSLFATSLLVTMTMTMTMATAAAAEPVSVTGIGETHELDCHGGRPPSAASGTR